MRRFVWLASALIFAVTMLLYLRTHGLLEQRSTPVADSDVAQPSGDREQLVAGLFQGALRSAVDGVDFAETPGYRRLLYHVGSMSPEDFSSRVSGRLDWADAAAHPERWRGEFVRVRGVAASIEAVRLFGQDAGIEDVYRGFIAQIDGSEFVAFDHVEQPPAIRVTESVKDTLDIEGVFYRTVRYESRTGETREIPYLVSRNLSVYQPTSTRGSPVIVALKVLGVVAVSVVLGLAVARWSGRGRQRKGEPAGFKEMFEARLREGGGPPGQDSKTS